MNKTELVDSMASNADLTKADAERALNAFMSCVEETLAKGGSVAIVGHGTYKVSPRAARKGRNPQTGAEILISASNHVGFKAGKGLKDAVNK